MTASAIKWTEQQTAAIASRGNVIVSASAGTGKTAVLSRRCIDIVTDPRGPVDIHRLLVLTFTKAAAAEMRERIYQSLRDEAKHCPGAGMKQHLRRQLMLIENAEITTIHAFCKKLITEHFHRLGLDPTFRLMDGDEQYLLKNKLLSEVLEQAWQDERYQQTMEKLFHGRKVHRHFFVEQILAIDEFLTTVVSPEKWIAEARRAAAVDETLGVKLVQRQKAIVVGKLKTVINQIQYARWLNQRFMRMAESAAGGAGEDGPTKKSAKKPKKTWEQYLKEDIIGPLDEIAQLAKDDRFDLCREQIREFAPPRWPTKPKEMDAVHSDLVKGTVKKALELFKGLTSLAVLNQHYEDRVASLNEQQTNGLLDLVELFSQAYRRAKHEQNSLDFSDLEHLCLKLLYGEEEDGPLIALLRQRYRYIIVDEYQDINPVQEAILQRLADGDNLFCVGDIKQSIYGFRGAEPDIFRQRLEDLQKDNDERSSAIALNMNFRSRRELLGFANLIFERLMREPWSGLVYDDAAALRAGRGDSGADGHGAGDASTTARVQVLMLDKDGGDDDGDDSDDSGSGNDGDERYASWLKEYREYLLKRQKRDYPWSQPEELSQLSDTHREVERFRNYLENAGDGLPNDFAAALKLYQEKTGQLDINQLSTNQREAAYIAAQIQQLVQGKDGNAPAQVMDKGSGAMRPVTYGDIVILTRALSGYAHHLTEMLRLAGIPVNSQVAAGFFETTEIHDMMCLLKVLDNPQQDIELAAVLRSPFFALADGELLVIREGMPAGKLHTSVYQSLFYYMEHGEDEQLRGRLRDVVRQLEIWRDWGRKSHLSELIWKILRETRYLAFVTALPNGRQRRANLLKLHDRAIQFEGFAASDQGALAGFVDFVHKLIQEESDWAPAEPDSSQENAVRIMTVHKSKGLEFPIVFLANLDRAFNQRSLRGDCLLDQSEWLGLEVVNQQNRSRMTSMGYQVIRESLELKNLAEEMRILYVALTRAREQLYLVASVKRSSCEAALWQCVSGEGQVQAWQLMQGRSHWQWLLLALANEQQILTLFGIDADAEASVSNQLNGMAMLHWISAAEQDTAIRAVMQLDALAEEAPAASETAENELTDDAAVLDDATLEKTLEHLTFRYPYQHERGLPAKASVTALAHQDELAWDLIPAAPIGERLPRALQQGRVGASAMEKGSATHLIFERLDLAAVSLSEEIQRTIAQLVDEGMMTAELGDAVDCDAVEAFFKTEWGSYARQHPDMVQREWPFTTKVDLTSWQTQKIGGDANAEGVIVQGIVDMLIDAPQGLVIVDFKTDRVQGRARQERVGHYRRQLGLYAIAVEKILKRPVQGSYLFFLHGQELVEV